MFSIPAGYGPYVVAEIALTVANIGREEQRRQRGEATKLVDLVTAAEPGRIVIVVMDEALADELAAQLDPKRVRVA